MPEYEDECAAEFIGGSFTSCGCEDCQQQEYEDIESDVEAGALTEDEALELHRQNGI